MAAETELPQVRSRRTSNSTSDERVKLFQRPGKELSELSNLPDTDTDNFNESIREQNSLVAQRQTQHDKWRNSFEEKKRRVFHRITDFTERKKTRIQNLENVLQLTYERFVHNRNTTDHEKTFERAILSRAASQERSGLIGLSRENSRPLPPVITEERQISLRPTEEEYPDAGSSQSSHHQWNTRRQHARHGEQFVRGRHNSPDLDFQESVASAE